MDFIDVKYINLISSRLQKVQTGKTKALQLQVSYLRRLTLKHKNKARGFLYQVKNNTNYKCYNCGISISLVILSKNLTL